MVHALLTSSGFSSRSVWQVFCDTVQRCEYTTAVIITTAHPKKEKAVWAQETRRQMESIQLATCFFDIASGASFPEDIDVMYVCGGNTFSLLQAVREHSFANQIEKLFDRGGFYVGSSAGSVILSPTIASAAEIHPDKNTFGLEDLTGVGMIDFHIIPHFQKSDRQAVRAFAKRHLEPTQTLANGKALYIHDDTVEKV